MIAKIDEKKVEELGRFLDNISVANDLLEKLRELELSGALDAGLNMAYTAKVLRDMLNEEALEKLGKMASNAMELMSSFNESNLDSLKALVSRLNVANRLLEKVEVLESTGALDAALNLAYVTKTLKDMLNDEALDKLGKMASNALELASSLDSASVEALKGVIRRADTLERLVARLEDLERTGTLDVLVNLAYGARSLKDMLNDEALGAISKYVSIVIESYPAINEFLEIAMSDVAQKVMRAVASEETAKALESPPQVKLGNLLKWLSDPEVQRGLGVLMILLKAIGKQFS
ncbi:MAG: DUF1641 domain-containing protein [Sulfolobaceae archaeon]|nr:DUF1641 domain-containing protein [Sulfolobales archaeon]